MEISLVKRISVVEAKGLDLSFHCADLTYWSLAIMIDEGKNPLSLLREFVPS